LIWWPARKLMMLSQHRLWENSMVALRNIVPLYQPLQRGSDKLLVTAIRRYHPVVAMEMPWLYCRTVTGKNTWDADHFQKMVDRALTRFEGEDYEKAINRLAERVPIRPYREALEKLAAADLSPELAGAELRP
jgi:hypothetical protein